MSVETQQPNTGKSLLDLPSELRETIYHHAVLNDTKDVTMLPDFKCYNNEISASQPALCQVNRQLRREVLPIFYGSNLFLAQLDNLSDLLATNEWLTAIGDENVGNLKRLALCGWTRVPFGHMSSRRWIRVVLHLRDGHVEMERKEAEMTHPHVEKKIKRLNDTFRELVEARQGARFDVKIVQELTKRFSGLCYSCY